MYVRPQRDCSLDLSPHRKIIIRFVSHMCFPSPTHRPICSRKTKQKNSQYTNILLPGLLALKAGGRTGGRYVHALVRKWASRRNAASSVFSATYVPTIGYNFSLWACGSHALVFVVYTYVRVCDMHAWYIHIIPHTLISYKRHFVQKLYHMVLFQCSVYISRKYINKTARSFPIGQQCRR